MTLNQPHPLAALLLSVSLVVSLPGCSATAPTKGTEVTASPSPAWPGPPAPARIRFLNSIVSAKDWGIQKSLFRRLLDVITGGGNDLFVRPTGVAEFQRVLYVADLGAHALWILDAQQNQTHKVERIGDEALLSPVAVAVRPDGAVYLADSGLKKVFLIGRDGKLLRTVAKQGLERPAGLAYDSLRQWLYVADSAGQKIVVYGPDDTVVRSWGHAGNGDGEFNYPTHLALGQAGTLLVTDALNFRVQSFDLEGHFLWKFGHHGDGSGDISSPKGVATDRDGHIFLVDALFDMVQIFDRDGRYLLGFGGEGIRPGQFWLPGGVFINAENEIFVADNYNRRIQVFLGIPNSATAEDHQ